MGATKINLSENWTELKSKLQKRWGKLSDTDLAQVNGNSEELIKLLRKFYGYGQAQAEIEINRWLSSQGD